jgi:aryl-alcohol dehydrogenase
VAADHEGGRDVFLPLPVELWERGDFPVDRFMTAYDFERIEQAAHDAEAGAMIKPVLRMT